MSPSAAPVSRWVTYLRLGRVSNLPTVWSNLLAGVLLAGGLPTPRTMGPLLVAVTLFYTGGMFLNDAFDHAFDKQHRPERPIPAGLIRLEEVFAAGFLQLLGGLLLLVLPAAGIGPLPVLAGVVLAAIIVYYDFRHKTDPLGPVVMALTRGMVYLIAATAVGGAPGPVVWWGVAVMVAYLTGLTYAAKQETLRRVLNGWPLVLLAAPFAYAAPLAAALPWGAPFYAGFLAWVVLALSFLLRREGRDFPRAVTFLIAGISLLDATLILHAGAEPFWALWALAAWGLTLFLQRFVTGT